jgi:hypothetical protein
MLSSYLLSKTPKIKVYKTILPVWYGCEKWYLTVRVESGVSPDDTYRISKQMVWEVPEAKRISVL